MTVTAIHPGKHLAEELKELNRIEGLYAPSGITRSLANSAA